MLKAIPELVKSLLLFVVWLALHEIWPFQLLVVLCGIKISLRASG